MEMFIIKSQLRLIEWRNRFNFTQKIQQKMHSCGDNPLVDSPKGSKGGFVNVEPHDLKHHDLQYNDLEYNDRASSDNERADYERGDVPGWVLVVLMTTGLVTAIWTIASPRLSTILRNSLDAMNGIR